MSDSDRQDVKTGPPGHPDSGAYRVRRQGTMIVKTHTRQTASSKRRGIKSRPKATGQARRKRTHATERQNTDHAFRPNPAPSGSRHRRQRFASAPLWAVALIAAAVYAGAWLTRKIPAGRAYVYASLFCTGLLLADLSSTKRPMPRNERLAMIVEIDRTPSLSERWAVTTARAGMYRCFGRQAGTTPARWQPTDEKIELRFDTGFHVSVGEQMAVAGYLNPIDTSGSRYGALMRSRA